MSDTVLVAETGRVTGSAASRRLRADAAVRLADVRWVDSR